MRVIPILLLHNGGLVKSINFRKYQYVGDPLNAVKIFNEKEVDEISIIDIDATRNGTGPNFIKIAEIASEAFMPLSYGGGISTIDQVKKLFFSGVEKVIINKIAHSNPELISEISRLFGSQSVVVSIDVKRSIFGKHKVYINNGTIGTNINPGDFAKSMEKYGAGEILLNSIDRDGTYKGFDLKLIKEVSGCLSVPIIAVGGAGTLQDFEQAKAYGASAVGAGSMFVFQRPHQAVLINYPAQSEMQKIVKY